MKSGETQKRWREDDGGTIWNNKSEKKGRSDLKKHKQEGE